MRFETRHILFWKMTSLQEPSKVFARLSTLPIKESNRNGHGDENPYQTKATERDVHVTAYGEVSALPDRCKVVVLVSNKKESVQDAKNSVSRRTDYILQSLHNQGVKDGDIQVIRTLTREESMFHMTAEIIVTFIDISKQQRVCNHLVEKLDNCVRVLPPHLYHSPHRVETLRRQATLLAVENARRKAQEIAQYVNQSLGLPLTIREEQCEEWEGSSDNVHSSDGQLSAQQKISQATIFVNVKVFVVFELKAKVKTKQQRQA